MEGRCVVNSETQGSVRRAHWSAFPGSSLEKQSPAIQNFNLSSKFWKSIQGRNSFSNPPCLGYQFVDIWCMVNAAARRECLEKQLSSALPGFGSSRWDVFYLYKRSRIGEWLKYLCFEKYFLSVFQYSSLQNNPLIQTIEFVFYVFAFYYQYFRACIIHFYGH